MYSQAVANNLPETKQTKLLMICSNNADGKNKTCDLAIFRTATTFQVNGGSFTT